MKKIIFGLGIFFSLMSSAYSQELSYGLKAGINYSMGGQITGENSGVGHWEETIEGTSNIGFHGGIFAQVNFGKFFIRPEVVYTSLDLDFKFPKKTATYSVKKFDIPILIGYNIWGPLDIYAGPSYSNILDTNFTGNELTAPVVAQNSPINAQIGAKVEFGRIGIDLRYEHSLSSAEMQELDIVNSEYGANRAYFDDARINHLIVSVIFKLGGPGLSKSRKNVCY